MEQNGRRTEPFEKIEQEQNDLAEKGSCSRQNKMILKSQYMPSSMGTKTYVLFVSTLKSTLNNFDWARLLLG